MTRQATTVVATACTRNRAEVAAIEVHTPLDLIRTLEHITSIATVMLADVFAHDRAIASFVRESYPWLRVVVMDRADRTSAPQVVFA